ncbi:platelet glycoprotein Ib alpha chain isoform X3 [Hyla sarda]|uniref:platelet glycoprotein Ib alpha chain isoform X3 n=1 Tax=Hyla sarda TaxID=327740 RepID=UPI0024C310A6|nr:platelet glycoprotein Ib alpha chain isoform X3 [Hyla sarda]
MTSPRSPSLLRFIMNFLHHFGFLGLIVVGHVFSQPSCSTEKNLSKGKEETSCISLGLSTLPLGDISMSTAILILSYNNFKSLSTSTFKSFKQLTELEVNNNGMSSFDIDIPLMLEELNLANNSLTTLPKVSQLSGLTTLQLSNNMISTIPPDAFMGLKKLTRLELQHNSISSLSDEVFDGLHKVKHLDLSYNQLRFLPNNLLSQTIDLEILYLSGNRLTEIPDHFFGELELNYVYLENNPWNCNCALRYFKEWLEEDEDRIYENSKEGPTKNQKSVLCEGKIPLVEYSMDYCFKKKGDGEINLVPKLTKKTAVTIKAVHTEPMTTPLRTTTPLLTTATEEPTTQLRTTKWWPTLKPTTLATSTPTTQATTLPTSTPTTQATTTLPTSTPTTRATTSLPTSMPTTQATTRKTLPLKKSPRSTVWPTTTPYPTLMTITTKEPATNIISSSKTPTSEAKVKESTMSPTDEPNEIPVNTMLPAIGSHSGRFTMKWLEKFILDNCCLLHLIIYGLCIFLLLVGMIIMTGCLLWIYCCNHDLLQWLPGIRLIRYSLKVPMSDEDVLLVNNGAIESHFRDQSLAGVTKMLVLESFSQKQEIIYTSAIL